MNKRKLFSAKGEVRVANDIVEKIVHQVASEIDGVTEVGTPSSPGIIQLLGLVTRNRGINVEVGTKQVAIDLEIEVEYGSSIPDIVRGIRRNVTQKVNDMTGLEVIELNIRVNDLHFEDRREAIPMSGSIPHPRVK
jgi:uncharacterized alkaline shock family protein YloU